MTEATEDPFAPRPLAGWYYAGALASFLFMLLGCAVFLLHMTTNPGTLPLDERAAFLAIPAAVNALNGVAVGLGIASAIMLLLRRRISEPLMFATLIATAAWLGGLMVVPATREAMTANDMAVLIAILAIVWTIYWFARHSRQRGWLR